MAEKNLHLRLREKQVDLRKMIGAQECFVSESYGSSGFDGGCTRYSLEQMRVFLSTVPDVFPSDFTTDSFRKLTREQEIVYEILHELEPHPSHNLSIAHIPRIIKTVEFYLGRDSRELYLEGKLEHKPPEKIPA